MAEGSRGRGKNKNKNIKGDSFQGGAWQPNEFGNQPPPQAQIPFQYGYGFQNAPPQWAFPNQQFPGPFPPPWQGIPPWRGQPPMHQGAGGPMQQSGHVPAQQAPGNQGNQAQVMQQRSDQLQKQQPPKKRVAPVVKSSDSTATNLNSYSDTICYGCGVPGHFQVACTKPAACYIYKMVTHTVEECPVRKRPLPVAKYVGSSANGLGYYNIDVPDVNDQHLGNLKNIGLVLVEPGEITNEELANEFSTIYKTNWPWQIRKLDSWSFLVQFPPEIKVETVAAYPCFGLSREDLSARVIVWDGEIRHVAVAEEVWVQLRGLNPKWRDWGILAQITSAFGVLQDVDWKKSMHNLAECVRVKISCKDHTKIPEERMFEVKKKFYPIKVTVEPLASDDGGTGTGGPGASAHSGIMDTSVSAGTASNPSSRSNSTSSPMFPTHSTEESSPQDALAFLDQLPKSNIMQEMSPASMLKEKLPEPLQESRRGLLEAIMDRQPNEEQCYNLLRDMELVDEEGQFVYDNEGVEVSFAAVEQQDKEGEETAGLSLQANKWGPVYGTRQSARVQGQNKTIMELAQERQQIRNLEKPATLKSKGPEEDFSLTPELESHLQATVDSTDRRLLSAALQPAEEVPLSGEWLSTAPGPTDLLRGLRISREAPGTPPSARSASGKKSSVLSPASPLDLACWSPKPETPLKKLKHSLAIDAEAAQDPALA